MGNTTSASRVLAWGSWEHGQLGIGQKHRTDVRFVKPTEVHGVPARDATKAALGSVPLDERQTASGKVRCTNVKQDGQNRIDCGGHHSAAISSEGVLYTWGLGANGQLGHGNAEDVSTPNVVQSLISRRMIQISCGENHTAAVDHDGIMYTWGCGKHGRLGHGSAVSFSSPAPVAQLLTMEEKIRATSCGSFHTACLNHEGSKIFTFGMGQSGRLGLGDENDRSIPHQVPLPERLQSAVVKQVVCGGHHTGLRTEDGVIALWGGGAFGKLGHGDRLSQRNVKVVEYFVEKNLEVKTLSLGSQASICATATGQTYTWGQGSLLGHPTEADCLIPRQQAALSGLSVTQVGCGLRHMCAVTRSGEIWSWGSNADVSHCASNRLPNVPTPVAGMTGLRVSSVACGNSHSLCVVSPTVDDQSAADGKKVTSAGITQEGASFGHCGKGAAETSDVIGAGASGSTSGAAEKKRRWASAEHLNGDTEAQRFIWSSELRAQQIEIWRLKEEIQRLRVESDGTASCRKRMSPNLM